MLKGKGNIHIYSTFIITKPLRFQTRVHCFTCTKSNTGEWEGRPARLSDKTWPCADYSGKDQRLAHKKLTKRTKNI